MAKKNKIAVWTYNALFGMGVFRVIHKLSPNTLTVLNYHRLADSADPIFKSFKPNVSATSAQFARQMDYVKKTFNVVNTKMLADWLRGDGKLPSNPALITFDDGYHDNLSIAYPILKERELSAVIFLAVGYIGTVKPFYWDLAAYAFFHTKKEHVTLPSGVPLNWKDPLTRDKAVNTWVTSLKQLPENEKQSQVANLVKDLDVTVPDDAFQGMYLNWDQARAIKDGVIEFGAHTVTHPILTRIPSEQVEWEIAESKRRIEKELDKPVLAFAYPNGGLADFSPTVVDCVRRSGYEMAFTLVPGPVPLRYAKDNPLEIPRIFLGDWDTMPRFAAKLAGAEVLQKKLSALTGLKHQRH